MRVHDNGIDREATEEEEAEHAATLAHYKAVRQAAEKAQAAKNAARQAVLDKLGLTADEAAALLG